MEQHEVVWFNERKMPHSLFEIEHSTDIQNSLVKFCDLQDFACRMVIVADAKRKDEFDKKLNCVAFKDLNDKNNKRVSFLSYESLSKQYENLSVAAKNDFNL